MTSNSSDSTYGSGDGSFRARLGQYKPLVEAALDSWDRQQFSRLLWAKDPTPWKQPEGTPELVDRLGWLNVADTMLNRVEELTSFAEEIRSEGITSVVVLGMGGSSLSPEVSYEVFGSAEGFPKLFVLDSTVPAAILDIERHIDLASTLFVVSSKSGETAETLAAYRYAFRRVKTNRKGDVGSQFVAITDEGSWFADEAKAKGFRRVFLNMPEIGGRYSALSYFGLVPAGLIGMDIRGLLKSARKMMEACSDHHPARKNPGVALGAIMGECALRGRDKLYMVFSEPMESLGCWIEQLVAESTGKNGQGVLPIEGEFGFPAAVYPDDCLFVYTRLKSAPSEEYDRRLETLAEAGHPVVILDIEKPLDLGGEYFRWEMATAVASAFLSVNPFDQPNVALSKNITKRILRKYTRKGEFDGLAKLADGKNLILYADDETAAVLKDIREHGSYRSANAASMLQAHLSRLEPGDYVSVMAYLHGFPRLHEMIQAFRIHLQNVISVPTTLGYGPRLLHSTGQLHKGGRNNGLFIQITADDPTDLSIPYCRYTFGALKEAQALGDFDALRNRGRRIIRAHLGADLEAGMLELMDSAVI